MSILQQLQKSKGTISSALGKSLAEKVLKGDTDILKEAVKLIRFNDKNVRAGAAKIIEKVAERKPDLVADYLKDLLPALELPEPQTKWMVIHTLGLCAKLNPYVSIKALNKAKSFIDQNSGACLWDRTILYLGYVGAISKEHAREVFPILEKALAEISSQTKTVLESFERMIQVTDKEMNKKMLEHAIKHINSQKPSVKSKAVKIQKLLSKRFEEGKENDK